MPMTLLLNCRDLWTVGPINGKHFFNNRMRECTSLTLGSHQSFTSLLMDPPTSVASTVSPVSSSSSTHAQRRLHRTRQNLGSHRHDLLVALRVVNRIEKEVLEAEYENWLLDETQKCERVGLMLDEKKMKEKKEGQRWGRKRKGKKDEEDAEVWIRGYCGDCESALKGFRGAGRGLI
jgi:hypothetical protein